MVGKTLDPDGGFGKGLGELPLVQAVFVESAKMWEAAYGEPYREDGRWICDAVMVDCWHDCQDGCWRACSQVGQSP